PDSDSLQFQDVPTHISQSMRPFDLTAAISGVPAMPGCTVPGPGPVICGYTGRDPIASGSVRHSRASSANHAESVQAIPGPSGTIRTPVNSPRLSDQAFLPALERAAPSRQAGHYSPGTPGPQTPTRRYNAPEAPRYISEALSPMPEIQDTPRGLFTPIQAHNAPQSSQSSNTRSEVSPTREPSVGFEVAMADDVSEHDMLAEFRTLAIRDNQGLGRGLSSRWSELEEDINRLPKRTLFLLDDVALSPKPLKTFVSARLMQEKNFYWCILKWQMTYERRRLFHAMYTTNPVLQRAMYFHVTWQGSFLHAELYTWEWLTLALLLWEKGGHVDFMITSDFCKMLQAPGDMPVEWENMKKYRFVFFGGSSDPANELTDAQHHSLESLVRNNTQVWPHPISTKLVLQKSVIHRALARTIQNGGGLAERIYQVESLEKGLEFLRKGYVIKRDCSFESRHVFLPNREPYMVHAGENAAARAQGYEELFKQAWNLNVSGYKFFALNYNPALLILGEVRTFITFGRVIELIHTVPEDPVLKRDNMLNERCHGNLMDLTKMTLPQRGRFLDFSQQRRRNELWHCRDLGLDNTGTQQLTEFALKVYDKLVTIDESINRTNQFHRGIAGHQVCVRLDIGVMWDSNSPDPKDHRYRFIVNEIQPGDSGMFMIDGDARASVPLGIIEGILRGSLEHWYPVQELSVGRQQLDFMLWLQEPLWGWWKGLSGLWELQKKITCTLMNHQSYHSLHIGFCSKGTAWFSTSAKSDSDGSLNHSLRWAEEFWDVK
ncbi:hypothetical protein GGU10DRAFT_337530, partial [Lentinula aff. detonsa]